MKRTFIEVPNFKKNWQELDLVDEDLKALQNVLLNNPKEGAVIQGTGGLRKIRVPLKDKGKRGGARVLYVDLESKEVIYFINVYSKSEKEDLTAEEKRAFKVIIDFLKEG